MPNKLMVNDGAKAEWIWNTILAQISTKIK